MNNKKERKEILQLHGQICDLCLETSSFNGDDLEIYINTTNQNCLVACTECIFALKEPEQTVEMAIGCNNSSELRSI